MKCNIIYTVLLEGKITVDTDGINGKEASKIAIDKIRKKYKWKDRNINIEDWSYETFIN